MQTKQLSRKELETLRHVRDGGQASLRTFDLELLDALGYISGPRYRPEITLAGLAALETAKQ